MFASVCARPTRVMATRVRHIFRQAKRSTDQIQRIVLLLSIYNDNKFTINLQEYHYRIIYRSCLYVSILNSTNSNTCLRSISRNKLFDSLIKLLYFFLRFPRHRLAITVPSQHGETMALSLSFTLQTLQLLFHRNEKS